MTSLINLFWTMDDIDQLGYLELNISSKPLTFAINFGTWFLIFMNFVPISLMVTLECVKFVQAYFIANDYMIYDAEKD